MTTQVGRAAPSGGDIAAEHLPGIQYAFVHMLTEHLVDCRRAFAGDLDSMLILAVIGQHHIKAQIAQRPEADDAIAAYGMTASRIADVLQMPRQTVRRKLQAMRERGWLRQSGDAVWLLVGQPEDTQAGRDLSELTNRGVERALRLRESVNRILGVSDVRTTP